MRSGPRSTGSRRCARPGCSSRPRTDTPTRCSRPSSTAHCAGSFPTTWGDGGRTLMAVARRPPSAADWAFPFPAPGRPRRADADAVPPGTAHRWPFRRIDSAPVPNRRVAAPLSLAEFKARVGEWADDVGVISIDDPAIAHERDEVLWVYPHARSLVCLIGEENKAAMQSRYLPTANHELYACEERIFEMGHRTVKL